LVYGSGGFIKDASLTWDSIYLCFIDREYEPDLVLLDIMMPG